MEGRKWALLIGIDNYDRATPLRFARADVRSLAFELEENCGFASQGIRLLVDGAGSQDDVTHTGIIGALETMAGEVEPGDTFLFYFAGHGITRDDQSYLLGINTDLSSTRKVQMTSVPMAVLRDAISAIPAREKILILDACRNDPAAGRADAHNTLDRRMWDGFRDIVVSSAGCAAIEPSAAVLFACDVGQRSWEWAEKGHSVFNYYLLESLASAAEANGEIEFTGVASYVQRQMDEWTRRNRERPQRPIYESKGGARLLLGRRRSSMRSGRDPAGNPLAIELAFWNAIAHRGTPSLYREYLNRYPDGQFSVIARAWLESPPAVVLPSVGGAAPKLAPEPPPVAAKPPAAPAPEPAIKPAAKIELPPAASIPAPAPQPVSPPIPAPLAAGPVPPKLRVGVLVLLAIFSDGLLAIVWLIWESRFVKHINPRSKATRLLVTALLFLVVGVAVAAGGSNARDSGTVAAGIAIAFFSFLFYLSAIFGMRVSLVRYYNTVEPIGLKLSAPMTFFFHVFYFQYHFNRIALKKGAPPKPF